MTRTRKVWLWLGCVALLVGASSVIFAALVPSSGAGYANVVSIKSSGEYQNPILLRQAWALPVAALYRSDITYQHNASVCGPTSIVNVMHSLKKSGNQESVLQDTGLTTVLGYLPEGVTLDQLAQIAKQKLGGNVTVLRDLDLTSFREQLRHANDPSRRYIINFSRGPLFATGGGHHSPIAGYLAGEDLVLVLDVNEKYGPWLVNSARLFEAMDTVDGTNQKKRGLLLID
jgi:Phytochelatin synthase